MLKYCVSSDLNCIIEVDINEVANEFGLLTKTYTHTGKRWIVDKCIEENRQLSIIDDKSFMWCDSFEDVIQMIIDEKEIKIAVLQEELNLVNTFKPSIQYQLEHSFEKIDSKNSRSKHCKNLTKIVTCVLSMNFNEAPDRIVSCKDKENPEDEGICVVWFIGDYEIYASCFNSEKIIGLIYSSDHSKSFSFKTDSIEKLLQKYTELTKENS
jgi:hypothetical protein